MKRDDAGLTIEELAALTPEQREAIAYYESIAPDPDPEANPYGDLDYDELIDPATGERLRGNG